MYNKLFTKILDSSIWLEDDPTRIVWITLLAAMDEDGFAPFSAVGNLANRARVTLEQAEHAVSVLESPDKHNPGQVNEGKRIERVPSGFLVLKAKDYSSIVRREQMKVLNRERVRRHRDSSNGSDDVMVCNASVMQSDTDTDTYKKDIEPVSPATPSTSPDPKVMQTMWNEGADVAGLPRCIAVSKSRAAKCRERLSEQPASYWADVIARIQSSKFCRGQNDHGWVATFDWLIKNSDNALKVIEGKYDDRGAVSAPRASAAPLPDYADEWTCHHEPECPNRDWHEMKMRTDQTGDAGG